MYNLKTKEYKGIWSLSALYHKLVNKLLALSS